MFICISTVNHSWQKSPNSGGIVTYFKPINCPNIATRKQDLTHKLHYPHIATRKQDRTHKLQ